MLSISIYVFGNAVDLRNERHHVPTEMGVGGLCSKVKRGVRRDIKRYRGEGDCSENRVRVFAARAKLKFMEDLLGESRGCCETTSRKNTELEDLIRASNGAAEEAKSQARELEILSSLQREKKSVELERRLNMLEDLWKKRQKEFALLLEARKKSENQRNLKKREQCMRKEMCGCGGDSHENRVRVLRNELTVMQEKLESIENDLKAARLKESDIMAKLKSAEEQLEQREKLLEEATTRKSELEGKLKTSDENLLQKQILFCPKLCQATAS
ncbi:EARLY ENDOSOME ANTIGEN [Salix purpurea]|uniref:EARLY ENDOSOME ANTIGEN n=1 Tax=Salix purpurea TaxID=77065 RepID=A0A9Q0Q564_SALPP|nr:EARLY ENDOSOME ANTIGEN [Salix purpurea]